MKNLEQLIKRVFGRIRYGIEYYFTLFQSSVVYNVDIKLSPPPNKSPNFLADFVLRSWTLKISIPTLRISDLLYRRLWPLAAKVCHLYQGCPILINRFFIFPFCMFFNGSWDTSGLFIGFYGCIFISFKLNWRSSRKMIFRFHKKSKVSLTSSKITISKL